MSSLWHSNKLLGRCHSCSGLLEPKRKDKTRCLACARKDAKRQAEKRARDKNKLSNYL